MMTNGRIILAAKVAAENGVGLTAADFALLDIYAAKSQYSSEVGLTLASAPEHRYPCKVTRLVHAVI